MDHSPAEILQKAMIDSGLAEDPGYLSLGIGAHTLWPVIENFQPDAPDNVIIVYDTSGLAGSKGMISGARSEKPGFEILVRAMERSDARQKISSISTWLSKSLKRTEVEVGEEGDEYRIESVTLVGTIAFVGVEPDGKRRSLFSLNGRVSISQV